MPILEPRLKELPGQSRLALGFFNSIIRRIECTKPINGKSIVCIQQPDGIQINLKSEPIVINVCSNGAPSKLAVLYDPELTQKENIT